jgi:hypothetical protein
MLKGWLRMIADFRLTRFPHLVIPRALAEGQRLVREQGKGAITAAREVAFSPEFTSYDDIGHPELLLDPSTFAKALQEALRRTSCSPEEALKCQTRAS